MVLSAYKLCSSQSQYDVPKAMHPVSCSYGQTPVNLAARLPVCPLNAFSSYGKIDVKMIIGQFAFVNNLFAERQFQVNQFS